MIATNYIAEDTVNTVSLHRLVSAGNAKNKAKQKPWNIKITFYDSAGLMLS